MMVLGLVKINSLCLSSQAAQVSSQQSSPQLLLSVASSSGSVSYFVEWK